MPKGTRPTIDIEQLGGYALSPLIMRLRPPSRPADVANWGPRWAEFAANKGTLSAALAGDLIAREPALLIEHRPLTMAISLRGYPLDHEARVRAAAAMEQVFFERTNGRTVSLVEWGTACLRNGLTGELAPDERWRRLQLAWQLIAAPTYAQRAVRPDFALWRAIHLESDRLEALIMRSLVGSQHHYQPAQNFQTIQLRTSDPQAALEAALERLAQRGFIVSGSAKLGPGRWGGTNIDLESTPAMALKAGVEDMLFGLRS